MPEIGSIVAGKYRVVRQIGAGGMGTVVAAEHVALGTPIALKFLSEKVKDSSSSVERFTREARACAQLRSEHVCRVTDFGVDGGVPYLAMELLEGTDLSRLLDGGPLDIATATDYVLQASVGLAEAHAAGIVHRDLKPHNLFLSRRPDGSPLVKVLDFGIAKIPVADNHALTRTAHVVGSPGYMAPEQLRSSKTVDIRADVWALGVILYELVSARHPFRADAVTEIALKIAMDDPPPLTEAPALEAVVMKCLAKEPDDRFQDVGALAAALAPLSAGHGATAAIVTRILGDSSDLRRTTPHVATSPSRDAETIGAKTVRSPSQRPKLPDTTQQHGSGMVALKPSSKRRSALLAIGGLVVAGGIAAAVASMGGTTDVEPDAATAAATVPPIADAQRADPRAMLDATRVLVIADAAPVVIADAAPTVDAPQVISRRPPPPWGPGAFDDNGLMAPRTSIRGGAEIDAIRVQARGAHAAMIKRGLLPSDLGPAAGDEDAIVGALARGDTATAKMAVDRLSATLATIKIDRLFIQAKVRRVEAAVRGVKLTADQNKRFTDQLADAVSKYNDGNFAAANRTLNLIVAALQKPTKGTDADLLEPRKSRVDKDAAQQQQAALKAQEKANLIKILFDRITNAFTPPLDMTAACYSLANLDRDRVPWDRCVSAMCKVNRASVMTMISLAPFNQQDGLRTLCGPK